MDDERSSSASSSNVELEEDLTAAGPSSAVGIGSVSGASPAAVGISPLVSEPEASTPLHSPDLEGVVPPEVLWPMKDHRHALSAGSHPERGPLLTRLGEGPSTLFAIDDGRYHCMIGRLVGRATDGCAYSLVGRVVLADFDFIEAGDVSVEEAFLLAKDIALYGVFRQDAGASNTFLVQLYRAPDDVPPEYLPPSALIEFT